MENEETYLYFIQNIEKDNYKMLRSDLLQSLWNYKNTASAVKTFNEKHQAGIANEIIRSIGSSSTQREKRRYTPPSPLLVARVERDPVLFWRSSIATRIKEDAVDNVLGYTNLPDIDKYRISIGLNSRLDKVIFALRKYARKWLF